MNVTAEDRRLLDLDPVPSPDLAADLATDDDCSCLDLALNAGAFTDDQCIRGIDFSAKDSTDSDGAEKAELSFEFTSRLDDAGDRRMDDPGA